MQLSVNISFFLRVKMVMVKWCTGVGQTQWDPAGSNRYREGGQSHREAAHSILVQVLFYISASRLHHIYIFSHHCRCMMLYYFDGVLWKAHGLFLLKLHDTNPKSELCRRQQINWSEHFRFNIKQIFIAFLSQEAEIVKLLCLDRQVQTMGDMS